MKRNAFAAPVAVLLSLVAVASSATARTSPGHVAPRHSSSAVEIAAEMDGGQQDPSQPSPMTMEKLEEAAAQLQRHDAVGSVASEAPSVVGYSSSVDGGVDVVERIVVPSDVSNSGHNGAEAGAGYGPRPILSNQRPRHDGGQEDVNSVLNDGGNGHNAHPAGAVPFLESDVDYCLRKAATRFPPIEDPENPSAHELEGISKALRRTSCTRLILRTTMIMSRSPFGGSLLGNMTLPPPFNFTFPTPAPLFGNLTFPPLFGNFTLPPLFGNFTLFPTTTRPAQFQAGNFTFPTLFPKNTTWFPNLFGSTTPASAANFEAPTTTTTPDPNGPGSAGTTGSTRCNPCPSHDAPLTDIVSAIGSCTTQNALRCCACVLRATVRAIFSVGIGGETTSTTPASPALSAAKRMDELDLLFVRK